MTKAPAGEADANEIEGPYSYLCEIAGFEAPILAFFQQKCLKLHRSLPNLFESKDISHKRSPQILAAQTGLDLGGMVVQ